MGLHLLYNNLNTNELDVFVYHEGIGRISPNEVDYALSSLIILYHRTDDTENVMIFSDAGEAKTGTTP